MYITHSVCVYVCVCVCVCVFVCVCVSDVIKMAAKGHEVAGEDSKPGIHQRGGHISAGE